VETIQPSSIINFKLFTNKKVLKKKRDLFIQSRNGLLLHNKRMIFIKKTKVAKAKKIIFKNKYKKIFKQYKRKGKKRLKRFSFLERYPYRIYGYGYDPNYRRNRLLKKYTKEHAVLQQRLLFTYLPKLAREEPDLGLKVDELQDKILSLKLQQKAEKKVDNFDLKEKKRKKKKLKKRNLILRSLHKIKILKNKRKKKSLRAFLKNYRKNKLRYNKKKGNKKRKYFKRYNSIKDNYASNYIKKLAYGSSFYKINKKYYNTIDLFNIKNRILYKKKKFRSIKIKHANLLQKEKLIIKKKLRKLKSYLFNIPLSRIKSIGSLQDLYKYLIMLKPNTRLLRFFQKHIRYALLYKKKKNKFRNNWKIQKKDQILNTNTRNSGKLKVISRIIFQLRMKRIHNNVMKNIKLLKYLLRFLKHCQKMTKKEIIFLNSLLLISIFSLITLLPKNRVITKKLLLFLHYVYLYNFRLKYVYHRFNKVIFQERFLMLKTMSLLFSETIGRLYHSSRLVLLKQSIIRFMALHNRNINADFLVNYILAKLRQFFIIDDILQPLLSHIRRLTTVKSYRFIIAGRLTRKERAAYMLLSYGRMPPGTINMSIDYSIGWIALRFGMVSVRVFLLLKKQKPFYYYMEFKNKSFVS